MGLAIVHCRLVGLLRRWLSGDSSGTLALVTVIAARFRFVARALLAFDWLVRALLALDWPARTLLAFDWLVWAFRDCDWWG